MQQYVQVQQVSRKFPAGLPVVGRLLPSDAEKASETKKGSETK